MKSEPCHRAIAQRPGHYRSLPPRRSPVTRFPRKSPSQCSVSRLPNFTAPATAARQPSVSLVSNVSGLPPEPAAHLCRTCRPSVDTLDPRSRSALRSRGGGEGCRVSEPAHRRCSPEPSFSSYFFFSTSLFYFLIFAMVLPALQVVFLRLCVEYVYIIALTIQNIRAKR